MGFNVYKAIGVSTLVALIWVLLPLILGVLKVFLVAFLAIVLVVSYQVIKENDKSKKSINNPTQDKPKYVDKNNYR